MPRREDRFSDRFYEGVATAAAQVEEQVQSLVQCCGAGGFYGGEVVRHAAAR